MRAQNLCAKRHEGGMLIMPRRTMLGKYRSQERNPLCLHRGGDRITVTFGIYTPVSTIDDSLQKDAHKGDRSDRLCADANSSNCIFDKSNHRVAKNEELVN